jgi:hypothetical protein
MNKRDFFLRALMEGQRDLQKAWVDNLFFIVFDQDEPTRPFDTIRKEEGYYALLPESGLTLIEGSRGDKPLFRWRERFDLAPGELPNYSGSDTLITTYGNVLINHLCLVIPFGSEIPFQSGVINIKKIEAMIEERLADDPDHDDPPPPGTLYVRQRVQFCDHMLSLVGYNAGTVQSVTRKSLSGPPGWKERRAQLLEQYKDQLTDPAIIAKIGDEYEKMDREWLAGDPSLEFYSVHGKYFSKVRKKLFGMFGGEAPFSDAVVMTLIERSLEEGIDPEDLPLMINSLREGTFNRGAQTQLGGESTKTIYRMVGTSRIVEEDCGVRYGVPFNVTELNHKDFIKYYAIVEGKDILLTDTSIKPFVGKTVEIRSPLTCQSGKSDGGRNVCERCSGLDLSEIKDGIPATAAQIGGRFLSAFLAAMHGKSLSTHELDLKLRIR